MMKTGESGTNANRYDHQTERKRRIYEINQSYLIRVTRGHVDGQCAAVFVKRRCADATRAATGDSASLGTY
jgi:hypothetical protein